MGAWTGAGARLFLLFYGLKPVEMKRTLPIHLFLLVNLFILFSFIVYRPFRPKESRELTLSKPGVAPVEMPWQAPDTSEIPAGKNGELIRYGRELLVNTPYYLGPRGSVASLANSLSCQNCHLDAGTRVWGGNFGGVTAVFPKFRHRSGTTESIEMKINDCFRRSMNGQPLDTSSHEMKAMIAYMTWLGKKVPTGKAPLGSGLVKVPYLDRAADPIRGRKVYIEKCRRCHGEEGQGLLRPDGIAYIYPPLWGENSYNTGAGIYRLGKFVSFVKYNMPYGVTYRTPDLSDEEVWDVAAYVNSRPRPVLKVTSDWPDKTKKPVDHPFGPYADDFTEEQHKYGPFKPIEASRNAITKVILSGS